MRKQETSLNFLEQFLPQNTFGEIAPFFRTHVIHLTLTHERKSILGDYRFPTPDKPYHRISINATLNKYSFLITLLHELAHLLTHVHFKEAVQPHGKEWKTQFRHILIPYLGRNIFPADVEKAVHAYLHNPSASTCTDIELYKALYRYDEKKPGFKLIDDIAIHQHFETEGRVYEKLEQLRTRSRCRDLKTGKVYFFQGIAEVRHIRRKNAA